MVAFVYVRFGETADAFVITDDLRQVQLPIGFLAGGGPTQNDVLRTINM